MPSPSNADAIDAFWAWWSGAREGVLRELHDPSASWVEALSSRVSDIHESLQWEFGKGRSRAHHLCVSGAGDATLRVTAERWRSAAPADPDFEFYASRQRTPELALSIGMGGITADFNAFRLGVGLDEGKQRFDIEVHHPAFAGADQETAWRILWVVLDSVLGEDDVITWLGSIEILAEAPADEEAMTLAELRRLVDHAPTRWPEEAWAVGRGQDPETGDGLVFIGCTSAKYLSNPLFDTVCVVRLPYAANDVGLPATQEEQARVDAFWDAVEAELGDGVLMLCRSTGSGERRCWFYLRAENGPERRALERLATEHPGPVTFRFGWDPGWRELPL